MSDGIRSKRPKTVSILTTLDFSSILLICKRLLEKSWSEEDKLAAIPTN